MNSFFEGVYMPSLLRLSLLCRTCSLLNEGNRLSIDKAGGAVS